MAINYNLFYQNYVCTKDRMSIEQKVSNEISQYLPLVMKVFQKYPPPPPLRSNFGALSGVQNNFIGFVLDEI